MSANSARFDINNIRRVVNALRVMVEAQGKEIAALRAALNASKPAREVAGWRVKDDAVPPLYCRTPGRGTSDSVTKDRNLAHLFATKLQADREVAFWGDHARVVPVTRPVRP